MLQAKSCFSQDKSLVSNPRTCELPQQKIATGFFLEFKIYSLGRVDCLVGVVDSILFILAGK